ncbi:MAG: membrane protein insertion efficiency factor YidD [Lentisphaerae bacterium]|nr:membrane protein insertion efficiency factor YidD [Lentisphaerota bacterium]MCP4101286.1 membrane protein insertion efficiency factor YidD [Lentisphaerota bacterium]
MYHDSAPENCCSKTAGGSKGSELSDPKSRVVGGALKHFTPSGIFILVIKAYQQAISPWFPRCCRFEPSCSEYALQAFRIHGLFKGLALTVWRLMRCQPFCRGGNDPVPPKKDRSRALSTRKN